MNKGNFHTHTFRCGHASGSEEDYIKSAIKNEINFLGFSDHGPFKDTKYDFRMDFSEFSTYINEIERLKIEYKDKIKIYSGVEIEYFQDEISYYENLYCKYNLDYLLLGQHMWKNDNNKLLYGYDSKNTDDLLYYGISLQKAMDSRLFKIIGHPDFYMRFFFPIDKNIEKVTYSIIDSAVKNNSILEFNANGVRCGLQSNESDTRYIYPTKYFWNNVKDTNIKVMINSDCHNPDDIWDESVKKSYKLAEEWGLKDNLMETIFDL